MGAIAAVVGAAGGLLVGVSLDPAAEDLPSVPEDLHIVLSEGPLPQCSIVRGTGTVPADHTLWIFHRNITDQDGPYVLGGRASATSDGWAANEIAIGDDDDAGDRYRLVVAVAGPEITSWLDTVDAPDGLSASQLPPRVVEADAVEILRGEGTAPCG